MEIKYSKIMQMSWQKTMQQDKKKYKQAALFPTAWRSLQLALFIT